MTRICASCACSADTHAQNISARVVRWTREFETRREKRQINKRNKGRQTVRPATFTTHLRCCCPLQIAVCSDVMTHRMVITFADNLFGYAAESNMQIASQVFGSLLRRGVLENSASA